MERENHDNGDDDEKENIGGVPRKNGDDRATKTGIMVGRKRQRDDGADAKPPVKSDHDDPTSESKY